VLVVGSGGAAGRAVLDAFRSAGWDARGAGRADRADVHVDLDDPRTLVDAMCDVDLVVNTVPHPAMAAERAVLEHGGLLIDVADRDPSERAALRAVERPAGTVLLNWGVIPGTVSLVVAELLSRTPAATDLELAVTFSARATSGPAGGGFLHRELGRRARHATAVIPLPTPFGPRRCLEFAEGQDGWLGAARAGREVRTFVLLTERALHMSLLAVNGAGLLRRVPRALFSVGGRPRGSAEEFCVWVAASSSGRRLAEAAIGGHGMYRSTGLAAVAAAELLVPRRARLAAGCFDPAELLTLQDVEAKLAAGGVTVARAQVPTAGSQAGRRTERTESSARAGSRVATRGPSWQRLRARDRHRARR
jgi:hypothetical protein